MAYSVTKCDVGGSTASGYHYEYLCESADDISDLPTGASSTEISRPAPGSLAFVETDSSARYILKNSREWGEYPMAGGGGGGTGGGVMYVSAIYDEVTNVESLDKTAQEIINCVNGQGIVAIVTSDTWPINTDNPGDPCYVSYLGSVGFVDNVWCISTESGSNYYAATLDDYPTDQQPGG